MCVPHNSVKMCDVWFANRIAHCKLFTVWGIFSIHNICGGDYTCHKRHYYTMHPSAWSNGPKRITFMILSPNDSSTASAPNIVHLKYVSEMYSLQYELWPTSFNIQEKDRTFLCNLQHYMVSKPRKLPSAQFQPWKPESKFVRYFFGSNAIRMFL